MPLYDFGCEECGHIEEILTKSTGSSEIVLTCPKCEKELLWGGEDDYECYGVEGDGIVSNSTCSNDECDVEMVIIYTN